MEWKIKVLQNVPYISFKVFMYLVVMLLCDVFVPEMEGVLCFYAVRIGKNNILLLAPKSVTDQG